MVTISRPSLKIFQEFLETPVTTQPFLYPLVIGKKYEIMDLSSRDRAFLGDYDPSLTQEWAYPNKSATSQILPDFTQLYLDNAWLKYFEKIGTDTYQFRIVKGYKNRIKSVAAVAANELVLRNSTNASGTAFTRSTILDERDVQRGDAIKIVKGAYSHEAKVIDLLPESLPASVGAATASTANQAAQSHSIGAATQTVVAGDATLASSGTYVGSLVDDVISDIYTLTVVSTGSAPTTSITPGGSNYGTATNDDFFYGNAVDTYTVTVNLAGATGVAKIGWTSSLGDDSATDVAIPFGSPVAIGTKGLKMTFTAGGDTTLHLGDTWAVAITALSTARFNVTTQSGVDAEVGQYFPGFGYAFPVGAFGILGTFTDGGSGNLTTGAAWTIAATKAVDAVVATAGGTFAGPKDLTYIIEVSQGGLWGEAEIFVTSSHTDASGPTVVAAPATTVLIGNYQTTISFAANSQNGLVKGDKWTMPCSASKNGGYKYLVLDKNLPTTILGLDTPTVGAAVADGGNGGAHVATVSGTYTEPSDLLTRFLNEVYTVEITTGGATGIAQYTVTSSSGLDNSGPTLITGYATPLPLGNSGLMIAFSSAGSFVQYDTWTVQVTKSAVDVTLYIVKYMLPIDRARAGIPTEYAWNATTAKITTYDNVDLFDASWNSGTVALPVIKAKLYTTYKAFLPMGGTLHIYTTKEQIEADLGTVTPANEIAYGAYVTLRNGNFKGVKVIGLDSEATTSWDTALSSIEKNADVYGLVPLTFDKSVIAKFKTHVNKLSTPDKKKWRRTFSSTLIAQQKTMFDLFYNSSTQVNEDYLATVDINTNVVDVVYTFVEASESQNIDFVAAGIRVGDLFRYEYQTTATGEVIYTDYEIAEILGSTTLILVSGPAAPVAVPSKFTIVRNLTKSEQKDELVAYLSTQNDFRLCVLVPDEAVDEDNVVVPGYFLAGAFAGLLSGVPAQQGLTNFTLVGFKAVPKASPYFNETELDEIASAGGLIITQDNDTDVPFVRHQLTTDVSLISKRESSIVTNVDSVSYTLIGELSNFIGRYNITDETKRAIYASLTTVIKRLIQATDPVLGPQLISGEVTKLEQDPVLRDKLRADMVLIFPAPLNYLEVHLGITV